MKGLTLAELAEALRIPRRTVEMRLFRAGIKPILRGAIYDESVLEAIRNVLGKGRPPKAKPDEPDQTAKDKSKKQS
jgi:transcriptional regulator with XRE-family HTH domain